MDERSFLPNSLQLLQADGAVVVRAVGSHSQALRKKGNGVSILSLSPMWFCSLEDWLTDCPVLGG